MISLISTHPYTFQIALQTALSAITSAIISAITCKVLQQRSIKASKQAIDEFLTSGWEDDDR